MLKTLRITSLIAVILAVCGVAGIVVFGLKGDPEILAFLEKPSIVEQLKKELGSQQNEKKDVVSPLVAQAQELARRIDPPPPPAPPPTKEPPKPVTPPTITPVVTPPPPPPVQVSVKFNVLATVLYETAPEKSLALVSAGDKLEWFRQGEKVGQQEIKEIRDGSVILTQGGGKNPQEVFVPAKPEGKSLLKGEQKTAAATPDSGRSVIPTPSAPTPEPVEADAAVTETGSARAVRARESTIPNRPDVAERIQRVRSTASGQTPQGVRPQPTSPPLSEPTLEEQKASLEETISGIEELMNRQDEGLSEEERLQANQTWKELLEVLRNEKQALEGAAETRESVPVPDVPREPDGSAVKDPAADTQEEAITESAGSESGESKGSEPAPAESKPPADANVP